MHPTQPIAAGADSLAWMSGHWLGLDDSERLEEWWSEPYGGMLLGTFRWHSAGAPRFYELIAIEPDGDGLVCRIKHFNPGLVGWEEKEAAVSLDLVALRDGEAIFLKRGEQRWMIYRLEADGSQLVAWFETEAKPHVAGDEFRYTRA